MSIPGGVRPLILHALETALKLASTEIDSEDRCWGRAAWKFFHEANQSDLHRLKACYDALKDNP